MKKLNRPDKSVDDILSLIKNDGVSVNIALDIDSILNILTQREALYEEKIANNKLFEIPREVNISARVNKKKMITYYEYRILQRPKGRNFYDELMLSVPNNTCPYCTIHLVKTIDHFLPKSEYPSYSITPINLVPCCRDCNTDKKINFPSNSNDQTFHPYFDTVNTDRWLNAQLIKITPLIFQFNVVQPAHWDLIKYNRAVAHYTSYNINQLFSNEANRELRGMQSYLKDLYIRDPKLLKNHIQETFESCNKNLGVLDWKTLMYQELLTNSWFLEGCEGNTFFN